MPLLRRTSKQGSIQGSTHHAIISKLMDFLDSMVWRLPIDTFIEQRSIVFDRQQDDSELYVKVHQEFGELVDTLLECFCEDSRIRAEQLVEALHMLEKEKLSAKAKASFEPLAAAQSYTVFVPMMMRKNVELQLQALQMIEFMCGLIPSVLQLEEGETLKDRELANLSGEEAERYVLLTVLKQSKAEFEAGQKGTKQEVEMIMGVGQLEEDKKRLQQAAADEETKLAEALKEASITPGSREREKEREREREERRSRKEKEKQEESENKETKDSRPPSRAPSAKGERRPASSTRRPSTSDRRKQNSVDKKPPATASGERRSTVGSGSGSRPTSAKNKKPTLGKVHDRRRTTTSTDEPTSTETTTEEEEAARKGRTLADIHALLGPMDKMDPAAVAARTAYLREQRNKLLAMKQQEREKQLADQSNGAAQERPKTAKAARGMMRGGKIEDRGNEEILAARRALVAKLKAEEEQEKTAA